MSSRLVVFLLFLGLAFSQNADKARQLPIHTQVREDIFAGWMANDLERFQRGIKRTEEFLAERPDYNHALAWRGGAGLFEAVRAHEAGRTAEFASLYEKATAMLERAYNQNPKDQGTLAIYAGSMTVFADRLPESKRKAAWETVRTRYTELYREQQAFLDQMPVHMKGEVLAGLAQSNQRLGDWEAATSYVKRLAAMKGTPYKGRAERWLENPQLAAKSSITCMTCHDPGRLAPRLAELEKNAAK
jgi:tetratricopeptide (TPR) repeat protein